MGSDALKMHVSEPRRVRGSPHTRGLALPGPPGGTRQQCWAACCGCPARPAPGQAAFLQQGREKKSLVCTAGKGGGLAAAGRGLACVRACGEVALSGAAFPGDPSQRVECGV